jgi:uncharacterized protein (DUF2236 family)
VAEHDGWFPPDAVIRRVDGENALLFGAGRALLMQLAHPAVAQGVADHSDFEHDPLRRLRGTLDASYTVVFGTRQQAERMAATIRRVHHHVTGEGYRADDPALLLWVHATLVDTALRVYRTLIGPLDPDEEAEYYEQSSVVAELLGCPRNDQPADIASFRDYMRTMVCTLEVTPTARRVAAAVLRPHLQLAGRVPIGPAAAPALALVRFLTVGMLPEPLRAQYGFSWDARRQAALRIGTEATRRALAMVPAPLRRVAPAAA